MQSSANQDTMEKEVIKHWKQLGVISRLAGLTGVTSLMRMGDEQVKQVAAENAAVRKAMGYPEPEANETDETPMNTILGDVTYPAPVVVNSPQQPQKTGVSPLAAGLLGAAMAVGVPGAGVAGYFLNTLLSKPVPIKTDPSQSVDDETVEIRLGHLNETN